MIKKIIARSSGSWELTVKINEKIYSSSMLISINHVLDQILINQSIFVRSLSPLIVIFSDAGFS